MKIKGILIDLDDTLSDTKRLYKKALGPCTQIFNRYTGLNYSQKEFEHKYLEARDQTKKLVVSSAAKSNRAIYFQNLVENLDIETDFDLIHQLYQSYYRYVYSNMTLFPYAKELLKWFRDTGRKIVVVSDGNSHVRIKKVHALGIDRYIDFLVSSEEVGIGKPASQPFLLALHKINLLPQNVVMIGNSPSADIVGAKRLGIKSIQVTVANLKEDEYKGSEEKADYIVGSLKAIPKIIEEIENSFMH